jgi:serine/threonine-protein kinase
MAAPNKTDDLPSGTSFGRYTITRRIGSGGMGAVYEGTHTGLKKRVAIKVLHPNTAQAPDVKTRFLREGEAASRIRFPHVVDVYDVGSEEGMLYLVMEFLEGEDLGQLLKRDGKLTPKQTADTMLPVLAAVSVAHEEGIIHRDLKPANIFLARGRQGETTPKVLDFGISKILDDAAGELTNSGALLGTPYYMSPEQAQGAKIVTALSDQYSLGVILYQCVTGARPFMADSMYSILHSIVQGRFEPPRTHRPDLLPDFENVILKSMATQPDQRFASVRAFGKELLPFAGDRQRALWEPFFGVEKHVDTMPGSKGPPPKPASIPTPLPLQYTKQTQPPPQAAPAPEQAAPYAEPLSNSHSYSSTKNQSFGDGSGVVGAPKTGKTMVLIASGALVLAIGAAVLILRGGGGEAETAPIKASEPTPVAPPQIAHYRAAVKVLPADAKIELDGKPVGSELEAELPKDGMMHHLRVHKDGFEAKELSFQDQPPPALIGLMPLSAPEPAKPKPAAKPREAPVRVTKAPAAKPEPKAPKSGANEALILR